MPRNLSPKQTYSPTLTYEGARMEKSLIAVGGVIHEQK